MLNPALALAQGFSTKEAERRMVVPDGFTLKLVAGEPEVRQPILVKHDDRGRLWVIQYIQYPNPAGLKRVKVDRYSRTIYDRIPEPPPKGPRGADRITILEDSDGDGRADKFKDFVDGLNLCTGLAFGYGGVFVIQVPYLLFYPDHNHDDVPDGDPQVCLKGFGMEDSQSFANHLTWGPDGWLYGLNGSTTTCKIRGIEFQQGVWRYHPITKEFELFCEGGGNIYGLTFDADGQLFYSSNGTRPAWHGVQGAYYHKAFGKHGELHNPYAYGYFQFVPHTNYRGGHVTCGGNIYYGDTFPPSFRGKYIANNLLSHEVHWHKFIPRGSTFSSRREGELAISNDTWCAPVDLTVGPDGAVYFCDMYDKRTAHPDPDADWDRSNGRVYQVQAEGAKVPTHVDLNTLSSQDLVAWLGKSNYWYTRLARRILAERRDKTVIPTLRKLALESKDDHLALEALWALNVSGGFDDAVAEVLLGHRNAAVRFWTVRLLGDAKDVSEPIHCKLVELARTDTSPVVRSQLAASAKRLPGEKALPIVWELLLCDENGKDPFIPLLLWWAVESKADSHREMVLERFTSAKAWNTPLARDVILGRLVRRYAAVGDAESLSACSRLLASAPNRTEKVRMLIELDNGLKGSPGESIPQKLREEIEKIVSPKTSTSAHQLRLAYRCGIKESHSRMVQLATDRKVPTATRVEMLDLLGQLGAPDCVPNILPLLQIDEQHDVEAATLRALARFEGQHIAAVIIREYPRFSAKLKGLSRQTLLSRQAWAMAFLEEVDAGRFDPKEVDTEELRDLAVFQNQDIDDLVAKYWGRITRGTPEEKLADIRRYNNDLRAASGFAKPGRKVFEEHCGKCHKLFGEGEEIGPDLTAANRKDKDYLLASIVDPSCFIRVEYLSVQAVTADGRILSGLVVKETPNAITLVDSKNETITIARDNIEEMIPSEISQMPEDLLKPLTPQQLRDLFAYLRSDGPVKGK